MSLLKPRPSLCLDPIDLRHFLFTYERDCLFTSQLFLETPKQGSLISLTAIHISNS